MPRSIVKSLLFPVIMIVAVIDIVGIISFAGFDANQVPVGLLDSVSNS